MFLLTLLIFAALLSGTLLLLSKVGDNQLFVFAAIYMWTPTIATIVASRSAGYPLEANVFDLRASIKCSALALSIIAITILISFVSNRLDVAFRVGLGMPTLDLERLRIGPLGILPTMCILVFSCLVAGFSMNGVFSCGEEFGWRGFLYQETRAWGFWRSSCFVGLVWGLWHAPLVMRGLIYPGRPWTALAVMIVLCLGLAPLLTRLRDLGYPVTAIAVFHGTFNAAAGLAVVCLGGSQNSLKIGVLGLPGLLAVAIVTVTFCLLLSAETAPAARRALRQGPHTTTSPRRSPND